MSLKYLAEEMQVSIDNLEKRILKHINAYVSSESTFEVSAQNERQVKIVFPNQFAHIFRIISNSDWKTNWNRRKYIQIQC